jgi:hypothetical protein
LRWRKATEQGDWASPVGASVTDGARNEREQAEQTGKHGVWSHGRLEESVAVFLKDVSFFFWRVFMYRSSSVCIAVSTGGDGDCSTMQSTRVLALLDSLIWNNPTCQMLLTFHDSLLKKY